MNNPQCPGLRALYHAAKLRRLRAIASDDCATPTRRHDASKELARIADPLYIGPEAGPSALIARLEREGIEAVERTLAGRTDAPSEPEIGYVYDVRFPDKPGLGTARVRVLGLADGNRAINGRRLARVEMILGRLPKAGESAGAGPCDTVAIIIDEAAWTPVNPKSDLYEALTRAAKMCRLCRGTGTMEVACSLCGDSTFDHECNDRRIPCDNPTCVYVRQAIANAQVGGVL